MLEDIKLCAFPKEAGVYLFSSNDEIIYVGSSKNLYNRMMRHRSCIRQGSEHGYKQDLYQYLQANPFTVEFQITNNYRQLEQEFVEKYNPKYNSYIAYIGLGTKKGREAEYQKKYEKTDKRKKYLKEYYNQLCYFNCETITLCALRERFRKAGIDHPTIEAKKYLMGGSDD